jgi:hypothetical protein
MHLRTAVLTWPAVVILAACGDSDPLAQGPDVEEDGPVVCTLDQAYLIATAVVKDGIPALNQQEWVGADHPTDIWFLEDESRVVGIMVDGVPYAVPHSLLWFHEIANVTVESGVGPLDLAITFCPLTGSSMVFDRSAVDGAEFGVSGLLYKNNLIMYDRRSQESLWPQMSSGAECGSALGTKLSLYPSIEMTWDGWRSLHPDTRVLGSPVGTRGPYDVYPYGGYEQPHTGFTFPMPVLDTRLPLKERVLGIVEPEGATTAFPFGTLATLAPFDAVDWPVGRDRAPGVILWDQSRESVMVYHAVVGGDTLTFVGGGEGIIDSETGSEWTVDGLALSGPLAGTRLEPVRDAIVAFWGAWYAFHPGTEIWGPSKPDFTQ